MTYMVCQIHNNLLGQMDECFSEEEAVALVLKIVKENGVKITDAVKKEIKNDLSYLSEDKEWSVTISIMFNVGNRQSNRTKISESVLNSWYGEEYE